MNLILINYLNLLLFIFNHAQTISTVENKKEGQNEQIDIKQVNLKDEDKSRMYPINNTLIGLKNN